MSDAGGAVAVGAGGAGGGAAVPEALLFAGPHGQPRLSPTSPPRPRPPMRRRERRQAAAATAKAHRARAARSFAVLLLLLLLVVVVVVVVGYCRRRRGIWRCFLRRRGRPARCFTLSAVVGAAAGLRRLSACTRPCPRLLSAATAMMTTLVTDHNLPSRPPKDSPRFHHHRQRQVLLRLRRRRAPAAPAPTAAAAAPLETAALAAGAGGDHPFRCARCAHRCGPRCPCRRPAHCLHARVATDARRSPSQCLALAAVTAC